MSFLSAIYVRLFWIQQRMFKLLWISRCIVLSAIDQLTDVQVHTVVDHGLHHLRAAMSTNTVNTVACAVFVAITIWLLQLVVLHNIGSEPRQTSASTELIRVVFGTRRRDHNKQVFAQFHQLTFRARVTFQIVTVLADRSSSLADVIKEYKPEGTFLSVFQLLFKEPTFQTMPVWSSFVPICVCHNLEQLSGNKRGRYHKHFRITLASDEILFLRNPTLLKWLNGVPLSAPTNSRATKCA